jgi:hypothetical protein
MTKEIYKLVVWFSDSDHDNTAWVLAEQLTIDGNKLMDGDQWLATKMANGKWHRMGNYFDTVEATPMHVSSHGIPTRNKVSDEGYIDITNTDIGRDLRDRLAAINDEDNKETDMKNTDNNDMIHTTQDRISPVAEPDVNAWMEWARSNNIPVVDLPMAEPDLSIDDVRGFAVPRAVIMRKAEKKLAKKRKAKLRRVTEQLVNELTYCLNSIEEYGGNDNGEWDTVVKLLAKYKDLSR